MQAVKDDATYPEPDMVSEGEVVISTFGRNVRFAMNHGPTGLFDSYEQDFQQFIGTIGQRLGGEDANERTGERPPQPAQGI